MVEFPKSDRKIMGPSEFLLSGKMRPNTTELTYKVEEGQNEIAFHIHPMSPAPSSRQVSIRVTNIFNFPSHHPNLISI